MNTLIIIDVQNDFMPGGKLPVPAGDEVLPVINGLQPKFELVVSTQDWHPKGHASFATSHGASEFETIKINGLDQILWPEHCIQDSEGAQFHPELKTDRIESIFRKGTSPKIDSYSGFYDNAHLKSTGLSGYLKDKGASQLYFTGLAGDYCVYYSVKDALAEGFEVFLIEDATRPIDEKNFEKVKIDILRRGGKIIQSKDAPIF
ncbi:bifunctional nicotinamidase/pyrazinamidase [Gramella sp. AN32]|uniref:nicotinamidase n=1 Tax=Christiangramia antarctica TaxID=2058158 RepID=A0ABW5X0W6_9FLAO|nr:bifunctional nicotinamidase/pyrazinamidase [Gramella sp. AN32]MCM4155110.1 bifunctional nicotinamidase/pyrazinamidase [Gramella sp. AN32]